MLVLMLGTYLLLLSAPLCDRMHACMVQAILVYSAGHVRMGPWGGGVRVPSRVTRTRVITVEWHGVRGLCL